MQTVTIIAGNSDNKLTQREWHHFTRDMQTAVHASGGEIHFAGSSPSTSEFQNAAWVVVITKRGAVKLRQLIEIIRTNWSQKSVAWISGETKFI